MRQTKQLDKNCKQKLNIDCPKFMLKTVKPILCVKNSFLFVALLACLSLSLSTRTYAQSSRNMSNLRGLQIGEICITQRKALDALNAEGALSSDGLCYPAGGNPYGYAIIKNSERQETIETGLADDFRIYLIRSIIKWSDRSAPSVANIKQSLIDRFGHPALYAESPEGISMKWASQDSAKGQSTDSNAPLKGCQWKRINGAGTCPMAAVQAAIALKKLRDSQLNGIIVEASLRNNGSSPGLNSLWVSMYSQNVAKMVEELQIKQLEQENLGKDQRSLPKF